MNLSRYLKDRWVPISIAVAALAFVAVVLSVYALDRGVIVFVVVVLALLFACALAYDFLRRKRFYDEFAAVCADLDRKHLVTEVLERPSFYEGELAFDALHNAAKSMNDEIAENRRASEEYRDYIETWVHEVKTPIAAAELAVENDRTPATERIRGELGRIEGCVDQALYYARSTTLRNDYLIREADLAHLVKDVVRERSRTLIDAHISPSFEGLDQVVPADVKWCSFIIGQIIDNAAKYRKVPAGKDVPEGHLDFTAIRLDEGTAEECVVLSISDDGIGMPASDVARAFDRGFTGENGRRYGKSTGIGLYLCRQLCDKMGLGITLESQVGEGTRVKLAFPENRMYLP